MGLTDIFILDPKHDNIDKPFHYLLQVGETKILDKPKAYCSWHLPITPSSDMDKEMKQRVVNFFKKAKNYIDINKEKFHKVTPGDVPPIKNLHEYLNERQGQVVQVKLKDHRTIGIYPDNNKLLGEYDIEYHASTIVNMSKIIDIFDATEVMIKEA